MGPRLAARAVDGAVEGMRERRSAGTGPSESWFPSMEVVSRQLDRQTLFLCRDDAALRL